MKYLILVLVCCLSISCNSKREKALIGEWKPVDVRVTDTNTKTSQWGELIFDEDESAHFALSTGSRYLEYTSSHSDGRWSLRGETLYVYMDGYDKQLIATMTETDDGYEIQFKDSAVVYKKSVN